MQNVLQDIKKVVFFLAKMGYTQNIRIGKKQRMEVIR